MNPRVGYQVGLELREVNIERPVEPQRGGDGTDDLTDQPVEIRVSRSLDIQVPPADVVDSLVVHHERTVGMFDGGVRGQDCVVRLDHCSGHLRSRVDGEFQLRFLPIIHAETFHQ